MDNDNKFVKYGLIIAGALILLAMFLPITHYQRTVSDRVRELWWFLMYEVESGVIETRFIFELTLPDALMIIVGAVLLIIFAISGVALLILSCFTRSRPKLSKLSAVIGLGLCIASFIMMIMAASAVGGVPGPFYFDPSEPTRTVVMPHIGYIIAVAGLTLSGIVIKLTNWEAL